MAIPSSSRSNYRQACTIINVDQFDEIMAPAGLSLERAAVVPRTPEGPGARVQNQRNVPKCLEMWKNAHLQKRHSYPLFQHDKRGAIRRECLLRA